MKATESCDRDVGRVYIGREMLKGQNIGCWIEFFIFISLFVSCKAM